MAELDRGSDQCNGFAMVWLTDMKRMLRQIKSIAGFEMVIEGKR